MARSRKTAPAPAQNPLLALASGAPAVAGARPLTLLQSAGRAFADMLTGDSEQNKTDVTLEALREICRKGNPFPLIGYQWTELIVTDPAEQDFFRDIPAGGLDFVTPGMRAVLLDEKNPILRLDWWQRIILAGVFDPTVGEIAVKGCTGAGKGASIAMANCLWYDIYEECRVTLSSRDYSHAVKGIFGEVKMWFLRMRFPAPGAVLGQGISAGERRYIDIKNPDVSSSTAGEAFSGQHGKATLYTFDECTSLPDSFFENAEKNARKIIKAANPRTLSGRFRDDFRPLGVNENRIATCYGNLGNRLCVTVGGPDCMNVRHGRLKGIAAPAGGIEIAGHQYKAGERISDEHHALVKPLIENQIDLNQFRAICSKSDPRLVDVFAYGKFPKEDPEKQVILRSWLDFHIQAHAVLTTAGTPPLAEAFALDVARSVDGDKSCLAAGGQSGVNSLQFWQYDDINKLVAAVLSHIREAFRVELNRGQHPIVVDTDGLGAGAVDVLRAQGCWVIEYRGNGASEVDRGTYGNIRAEAYGVLGRRLNPDDRWRGQAWAIPNNAELAEELCAPEKEYSSDGLRFHLTPKNTPPGRENVVSVKKKLGRSPDAGDAVVMLFHGVRVLHNMNEWFMHATRELVTYPMPEDKFPSQEVLTPQAAPDPAAEDLRDRYGGLLNKPEQQQSPDWAPFYRDIAEEQRERDRVAREGAEAKPAAPPAWHERIWNDRD